MHGYGTNYSTVHDDARYRHQPSIPPRRDSMHPESFRAPLLNPIPVQQPQTIISSPILQISGQQYDSKKLFDEQMEEFWRLMEEKVGEAMWNRKRFMRLWNDVCSLTNDQLNGVKAYRGVVKKERKTMPREHEKAAKLRLRRMVKPEPTVDMKPPVPPRRDSML